jgi:L-ascorbate metabolism protein UlaG (beta-lactamase superfamily)
MAGMAELREIEICSVGSRDASARDEEVVVWWLGQAGFAMKSSQVYVLIDPYLSDFLAAKHAGAELPHHRMMPPPIEADAVTDVDWILCTHRHSDHMDPGTLPVLARRNPQCRFLVPQAEVDHALRIGLPHDRLAGIEDGQAVDLRPGVKVGAVAAAHEDLEVDANGRHHFLGYVLRFGNVSIYHSGDCIPYDGLEDRLVDKQIDLALLPINGRDTYRRSRNIPGNFTFDEAVALCARVGIQRMIGHHFGMFEFNTIDPNQVRKPTGNRDADVRWYWPAVNKAYVVSPTPRR